MSNTPIPLFFENGGSKLSVGLSWEPLASSENAAGSTPLKVHNADLSCVVLDADYNAIDLLTPQSPKREEYRQKLYHSGDQIGGGSLFEDEEIQIWLDHVDESISGLVFLVSTKGALYFDEMNLPDCKIMDGISWASFFTADLAHVARPTMEVGWYNWYYAVAAVLRNPARKDEWAVTPMGFYVSDYKDVSKMLQERAS